MESKKGQSLRDLLDLKRASKGPTGQKVQPKPAPPQKPVKRVTGRGR
jgi:hypothetical protein